MEDAILKKLNLWYMISLTVGLIGLIDVMTQALIRESTGADMGVINYSILYLSKMAFGTQVAVSLVAPLLFLTATWFIWLAISAILKRKINKLTKAEQVKSDEQTSKP